MSETLTFGPEWLRALSSGTSVTSPPPSPGPKYKLADYRYGKEEMLALFSEDVKLPLELELFESICRSRPTLPLAFMPLTEEEQRNSVGSVNSNAVLKLMGRGAVRGVAPVRGPGRGIRGRGRGDGGFTRQTSYEDTRGDGGGGFGRGTDTRRQGWNESSRGGFERSTSLRESGPSGPGRGAGYDPTSPRPRLTSDTSWERVERRSDSGNWRSGVFEDDDGWRVSGQRSLERSERWRGGSTRGRGPWRGGIESYRERTHPDDDWQTARGVRSRSYHDQEDVRWSSSNERLPEWSNNDTEDFQTPGTFDASGAFVVQKQNEEKVESKGERNQENTEVSNQDGTKQMENDRVKTTTIERIHDKQKEESYDKVQETPPNPGTTTSDDRRTTDSQKSPMPISPSSEKPSSDTSPTSIPSTNFAPLTPSSTSSSLSSVSSSSLHKEPHVSEAEPLSTSPHGLPQLSSHSSASLDSHSVKPTTVVTIKERDKKEDEPNMEHFAQAAENLVASLDDDEQDDIEKTTTQQQEYRSSPSTPEEVQWSYTDPQGKVQGPFSNSEMADWFSHGYFTMSLLVKRTTDEAFQPLGEVIKQWGRVPFIPGPQPPPFKGIPEHIQRQQQQMIAQQQYQHLMQQHYIQQQLFHQQALMMQQQQLQQSQQQIQQIQQPQLSPPQNTSPPNNQHPQPQANQGGVHPLEQQHQQSRPQNVTPHAESIWGPTTSGQVTPSVIRPGAWSPVTTNAPGKGWDRETSSQQNVPSFEEIQRMEEEKEKQDRLEAERREAQARALRLEQEEKERRLQEAALLQKQREEEDRRKQEEAERQRKEQEELRKRQQEEARRKHEEELRRKQAQQEALRQQEQYRKQQQLEQKQQEEQKRMNEMRQQQQQAMMRLKQQQQELLRKKEMQQQAEMQQRELQQKLQQKRQESQVSGGSLWGNTPQVQSAMSLAQIQQQEERERQRRELQMQQLQAQQQREQQARAMPGWADRAPVSNQPVKSLLQIQQEQARQQDKKQQQQQHQGAALSRSQPSHNPLSSSVWGNSGSLSTSWGPSGNIWGVAPSKHPQQQSAPQYAEDDDDDDDDDSNGESFWDDAIKAVSRSRQQQAQPPHGAGLQQRQPHSIPKSYPSLGADKVSDKRINRDEEILRRLFRQQAQTDEFSQWCDQSLHNLKVTGIDIPTFSAFLKDVESPYEVYDYVKSYLGDSRETREFAREFIERRKKQKEKASSHIPSFPQGSVWGLPSTAGPPSGKLITAPPHMAPFMSSPVPDDPQDTGNKKKRKKKMQKVDPSILGFSVNAADRVNMGEIQSVED